MKRSTKCIENELIIEALRAAGPDKKCNDPNKQPNTVDSLSKKCNAERSNAVSCASSPAQISAAGEAGQPTPVIVCFGTMSISGDSVGPMVGTLLTKKYGVEAFVYGTEEHSVNGKNMMEWMDFILSAHHGAPIIAVDASLGQADRVGQVVLRDDGVCPAAIKGKKERFGDVGILAVVAENSGDALMQLMSVPHLYATELADKVAVMLYSALRCTE